MCVVFTFCLFVSLTADGPQQQDAQKIYLDAFRFFFEQQPMFPPKPLDTLPLEVDAQKV